MNNKEKIITLAINDHTNKKFCELSNGYNLSKPSLISQIDKINYNYEYNIMLSNRFESNKFEGVLLDSSMSEEEVTSIFNSLLSLK